MTELRTDRRLARLGFAETRRAAETWLVGGTWCDSADPRLGREAWKTA